MARQGFEWAITKSGPPPDVKRIGKTDYPHHDRASTAYTHYISGYTEEEIAKFLNAMDVQCTVNDIELDIQHIQALLPTRTLIAHRNDRTRLLMQRTEEKQYRRLISEALAIEAKSYLAAGLSPVPALKEYRQAVGLEEKPGGITMNVDQRQLHVSGAGGQSGVTSSEDLLRRVMDKMKVQSSLPPGEQIIEAETIGDDEGELEDDSIPDV